MTTLAELFPSAPALLISSVEIDSRRCQPGTLFFAMPGQHVNGNSYIADAVARGAVAVVTAQPHDIDVTTLEVPANELVPHLARCAAAVVGNPQLKAQLVGVTGTNGKTTVVSLIAQGVTALGGDGFSLGTLTGERTTPFAPDLYRALASCVASATGDPVIALEVSSHALDQRRVEGLHMAVSVFTNLTHEHLDYHGDLENYFQAKSRLFTPALSEHAVVFVDDQWGARLAGETSIPVTAVSRQLVTDIVLTPTDSSFTWRGHRIRTALLGAFNVDNTLLAMSTLSDLGYSDSDVARAASAFQPVSGRFEPVAGCRRVIVDYAHTPDALARILRDVRELDNSARLTVVFGCGGDRDSAKRPQMGAIAVSLADDVIVTSDNPRSEDPDAIIADVLSGVSDHSRVTRETDRRAAIALALTRANDNDIVVIAGKGHETTQDIGGVLTAFDDRVVAKEIMEELC